ncbi:MAG: DUF86 domain-containing protein [Methylotetracoccus sp.]|nr:DUF86 domain-containing protein [Methylotetracoccus sp.]
MNSGANLIPWRPWPTVTNPTLRAPDPEGFEASRLNYDATVRNLELIGAAAMRIPDPMRQARLDIPWRRLRSVAESTAWRTQDKGGPPKTKRVANFLLLRVTGMSRQVSKKLTTQSLWRFFLWRCVIRQSMSYCLTRKWRSRRQQGGDRMAAADGNGGSQAPL